MQVGRMHERRWFLEREIEEVECKEIVFMVIAFTKVLFSSRVEPEDHNPSSAF